MNSFTGETLVLMADGSAKRIDEVKVGDKVANSDPESDNTEQHEVTAVHITDADKDYVDLTILTADGVETINTTTHHPFYSATASDWVDAADLKPGDQLNTPGNGRVTVGWVRQYQGKVRTYNLSVANVHTFYVLAGHTPVLVHNACGDATHADDCYCNWGEPIIPRVDASSAADAFTCHAIQRLEQRGVSAEDAQAVLSRQPFSYHHDDQWKMGYYDPGSKVFVARTVDGNVNTVMANVSQAYIK